MPYDTSKQGEFKLAQFAAQVRPFFKGETLETIRRGFLQVKIRDPQPIFFPILFPQQAQRVVLPRAGMPFYPPGTFDMDEGEDPGAVDPSGYSGHSGLSGASGSSGESGISGSGSGSGDSGSGDSGSGDSGSGGSGSGSTGWEETTDQSCLAEPAESCRDTFGTVIGFRDCTVGGMFPPQGCPFTRGAATYCACWTDYEYTCGPFTAMDPLLPDLCEDGTCDCTIGPLCPYYTVVCCYDNGTLEVLFPSCCCDNGTSGGGEGEGGLLFDDPDQSAHLITAGII